VNRSAITFGLLFVVLGSALALDALGFATIRLVTLAPLLLIVVGLALTVSAVGDAGRR
jgi:hypothetical protein